MFRQLLIVALFALGACVGANNESKSPPPVATKIQLSKERATVLVKQLIDKEKWPQSDYDFSDVRVYERRSAWEVEVRYAKNQRPQYAIFRVDPTTQETKHIPTE